MRPLYCFIWEPDPNKRLPLSPFERVRSQPPSVIYYEEVGAIYGDPPLESSVETVDEALNHDVIIQHAMEIFPSVLPCRFGSRLRDEAAILRLIEVNIEKLRERLRWLEGKREVGIRVLVEPKTGREIRPETDRPDDLTPGQQYLLEKRQRLRMLDFGLKAARCVWILDCGFAIGD